MKRSFWIVSAIMLATFLSPVVKAQEKDRVTQRLEKKVLRKSRFIPGLFEEWKYTGEVLVDSIQVNKPGMVLRIYLSAAATNIPVRTGWVESLKSKISEGLGKSFRKFSIQLIARGHLLEDYIPNVYRGQTSQYDVKRITMPFRGKALVTNADRPLFPGGLTGKHIALWPSHGFFFDQQLDRWQWQRARLWETVEDIFPWSFTSAYLVPMLENAGATVLLPRERDTQIHEVIVDNDLITGASQLVITDGKSTWDNSGSRGFIPRDTLFPGQNPFELGTGLALVSYPGDPASLTYVPDIPETGDYAVYVSWTKSDRCIGEVRYEVRYTGGKARFVVNQCMGAGTWVYLGTFHFHQGMSMELGSVVVYGGDSAGVVTSDAVRFGGGMGNVARKPGMDSESRQKSLNDGLPPDKISLLGETDVYSYQLSGKPRWMEGSRYYLQFAGMPDSLVYNLNSGKNDYNDDYMSRGEWVNYLIGPSKPQYSEKYKQGQGIPVDLALAFHTDAGVTRNDSIIGTLGIYSASRNNGLFPDGTSKLASRDLTDLIQTQVVEDIRQQINPDWTRRGLWDKEYSEAWRPIVPSMLLELLSHQNLADMKYGLDPRFKIVVARAIYKGMLRYLSVQDGKKVVIQPLSPDYMALEILENRTVKLSWRPVADPLENTAIPGAYRVYMKQGDNGFDTGLITRDTSLIVTLPEWGEIYSFRVTAVNDGGESMPGETLSVSLLPGNKKPVLIVNAFDRICGPAFFDKGDMAGIAWWEDEGVVKDKDFSHSGNQYDFNRDSEWLHDDSQGWGASNADDETYPVYGNSFSFPLIHGKAFHDAGYSFISVSDEAFEMPGYNAGKYQAVDLIFGEERGTDTFLKSPDREFRVLTPGMMESLSRYTRQGGNVLISGAYIGTDMIENRDSLAVRFASAVLHYTWRTNHATTVGSVYATDQARKFFPAQLQFNAGNHSGLYRVESPDAIEPAGEGSYRIYRYNSGNCSAGVAYKGLYHAVALGFPIETLLRDEQRTELVSRVMDFFNKE